MLLHEIASYQKYLEKVIANEKTTASLSRINSYKERIIIVQIGLK